MENQLDSEIQGENIRIEAIDKLGEILAEQGKNVRLQDPDGWKHVLYYDGLNNHWVLEELTVKPLEPDSKLRRYRHTYLDELVTKYPWVLDPKSNHEVTDVKYRPSDHIMKEYNKKS